MTTHIRIPDIAPVVQDTADGSRKTFDFPFPIFTAADLEVLVGDAPASGFSVRGAGSSEGGAVKFTVAPAAGLRITLRRRQTYARTDDFLDERAPTPHELNDAVDQNVAAIQELAEEISRSVKRPLSSDLSRPVNLTLPEPEAGKVIGWNGSADALVNLTQVDTSDMLRKSQNLADLPDKAQARINLGLGSAAVHDVAEFASARLQPLPTGLSLEIGAAHQGTVIIATASIQLALPSAATVGYGWGFDVFARDGNVALSPTAADKINSGVNGVRYVVSQGASAQVISDGQGDWHVLHDRTVLRGTLTGLTMSRVDNTSIAIAAGQAADSTSTYLMSLAPITKVLQGNGAWSAGSGGNGIMSAGGRTADTWYHVFVLRRDADGGTDIGIDTSPVAANRPDGWSAYRRIGCVKTSAGDNTVIPFLQVGDRYTWILSVSDVINAAITTARTAITVSVPTDIQATALLRVSMTAAAAATFASLSSPAEADQAPGITYASLVVPSAGSPAAGVVEVPTNAAAQIAVRASAAANLSIGTYGWIDTRGRWE